MFTIFLIAYLCLNLIKPITEPVWVYELCLFIDLFVFLYLGVAMCWDE